MRKNLIPNFKEYLFESVLNKKYVSFKLDDKSCKHLKKYCHENDIDLQYDMFGNKVDFDNLDFHLTIMFSTNSSNIPNKIENIKPIKLSPISMDLFGGNKDILVIKIKVTSELL